MHPNLSGPVADGRRRDRLARAEQRRRAAGLPRAARRSRRIGQAERRMRRAIGVALRLRSEPGP